MAADFGYGCWFWLLVLVIAADFGYGCWFWLWLLVLVLAAGFGYCCRFWLWLLILVITAGANQIKDLLLPIHTRHSAVISKTCCYCTE